MSAASPPLLPIHRGPSRAVPAALRAATASRLILPRPPTWILRAGQVPLAMLVSVALLAPARTEEAARTFAIAAGDAGTALQQFSAQSGQQVLAPTELVADVLTREVRGEFTPQAALDAMLAGTRLAAIADEASGAFAIVRRPAKPRAGPPLNAAAIIMAGLTTDEAQERRLQRAAAAVRDGLVARGIPADAITLLPSGHGDLPSRDGLLAAMGAVKPTLDETWLILFGTAAPGRNGAPMFQVNGPRISAGDLAAAVGRLPGKKFVVLAMARSGGFLPALMPLPRVEAVAATATTGEINEPRFASMWTAALTDNPGASFRELAIDAAARVGKFYRDHEFAQGEHAQFIDHATGQIVDVPEAAAPPGAPGVTPP